MPTLTRDDWHLLTKGHGGGWGLLWLIADFDSARAHMVSGQAGGSYTARDGRQGWYNTCAKGLLSNLRTGNELVDKLRSFTASDPKTADEFLPWSKLKAWSDSQTAATRDEAIRLRAAGQQISREYPRRHRGIGRSYAWDRRPRGTEAEIKADLAALEAVNAEIQVEVDAHTARRRAHDAEVKAFLATLAPTLLDDMVLEARAS